tara:strand:- start:1344 stop:2639 length:1296 start_codon:yes stop_codon:yes gene_type:complete
VSASSKHLVAIVGGAVSGSVAASSLIDKGHTVVVIEQNSRPFGKIEDGLPKWHKKQREQEYAKINDRLNHPNIFFVPKTKLGKDISFDDLSNNLNFSAIILAIGASKDRPINLAGSDVLEKNSLVYQNDFIYWFNHQDEVDYKIEIKDGVTIIGGGLASLDVAKACQIELFKNAIPESIKNAIDIEEIETQGIPKICEQYNINYDQLNIKGATILYRRTSKQMPLADIPEGANEEVINRIQNVRGKILQKAMDKFLFNFHELVSPKELIINNNQLEGIILNKTELIDGKVQTSDEIISMDTTQIISSIGSIPEPIEGIQMDGETYKIENEENGIYDTEKGIFLAGNAVTGKGNIRDSMKHAEKVADYVINSYLNPLDTVNGEKLANAVEDYLQKKDGLSNEEFEKIISKVHDLQKRVDYHNNYNDWISANS